MFTLRNLYLQHVGVMMLFLQLHYAYRRNEGQKGSYPRAQQPRGDKRAQKGVKKQIREIFRETRAVSLSV